MRHPKRESGGGGERGGEHVDASLQLTR